MLDEYKTINQWEKVYRILEIQGKKSIVVQTKKVSFEHIIMSEDYYITNLDLFLMVNKYKIPTVFISGTTLKETGATNPQNIISFLYDSPKCCIIRTPGLKRGIAGKYSIVIQKNQIFLPIQDFPQELVDLIEGSKVDLSFDDYYNRVASQKYELVKKKIVL